MDGGFDRSFVGREGKSISRVSIPVIIYSLRVVLHDHPAPRWPADPRESCCIGSVVLVSALAVGHLAVFGECKAVFLNPYKTSIPQKFRVLQPWRNFWLSDGLGHVEILLRPLQQEHIPAAMATCS